VATALKQVEQKEDTMRSAVRLMLTLALLAGLAFLVLGYWAGATWDARTVSQAPGEPTGTTGVINTEEARERGAELGERAAVAADRVRAAVSDGSLTTKITAKMALDDLVKARAIDVTTDAGVVTLRGTVHSATEHDRAVALARETVGVVRVVDFLRIGG
jgi:osmotically-inducible protein OsmY